MGGRPVESEVRNSNLNFSIISNYKVVYLRSTMCQSFRQ